MNIIVHVAIGKCLSQKTPCFIFHEMLRSSFDDDVNQIEFCGNRI